ncbi:hypothetical protein [Jiangella muralis]|uniref:hypothetical protein n=1 Tax=Jiangella muralis TaxID=702383 RepID=UPI000ADD1C01|nr:hypothetical protein [Jiangella muralis]
MHLPSIHFKSGAHARLLAGLAALLVAGTGACGTDGDTVASSAAPSTPAPEPVTTPTPTAVPWAEVETYLAARHGQYRKTDWLGPDNGDQVNNLATEIVQFDRDAPYHDRSISNSAAVTEALGHEPPGSGIRFVTTDTVTLVRYPSAVEACGTQWVDLGDAEGNHLAEFGLAPVDPRDVEPFEVLSSIVGEPEPVRVDADGTLYEITVAGGAGLQLTSAAATDPGVLETLAGAESIGHAFLPAGVGPLELHVDYTDIAAAATGIQVPDDAIYRSTWLINADIPEFDPALPPEIADWSCLEDSLG